MFSIDGLFSGLDTGSIIEGLVSIQQSQIDRLTARKIQIVQKQSTVQSIEARLFSIRSAMGRLNRSADTVFDSRKVTSSDESLVTAAASSSALPGSATLRVNSLAAAHQIGSQTFNSSEIDLSLGSYTFQVGNRAAETIVLDETNNTPSGLVNAINAQSDDVSAALVNNQANGTYRILLTSKHTGTANQISVTTQLEDGYTIPDFSGTAVQAAANAVVQLGSGPGALTFEYSTNRVDGLIPGVTLNLNGANAGKEVTVSIQQDNSIAAEAIKDFVDEYNGLMSYIDQQSRYIAETNTAGPLTGNRSVTELQNRLRSFVVEGVPGLNSDLRRMSQIGVDITTTGSLTFNQAKFEKAMNGEVSGVSAADVRKLFSLSGVSSQGGVEFLLGSSRTKASTAPYEVDITQAAEQAALTGNLAVAVSTVIDSSNNQLTIEIDGKSTGTLTLANGTYTRDQLAAEVQSKINAASELQGKTVIVSAVGDRLQIKSDTWGLDSKVGNLSGSALATLGFESTQSATGRDVVGRFIVNGEIETAVGRGRVLTGDSGNANTGDLQVRVTLTPGQVTSGIEAELTVTRGVTARIDEYLGNFLDPVKGGMKILTDSYDQQIESFDESIKRVTEITTTKRDQLVRQFAALEQSLGQLQTTQSFLGAQLAALPGLG